MPIVIGESIHLKHNDTLRQTSANTGAEFHEAVRLWVQRTRLHLLNPQ